MKEEQYTEEELTIAIRKGGRGRDTALEFIYHHPAYRNSIIQFIKSKGGNFQDGEDMFVEAVILLDRKIRQGAYSEKSTLKGYLYNVSFNLWRNELRKRGREDLKEEVPNSDEQTEKNPLTLLITTERKDLLDKILADLGEKCKRILEMWKLSYSMEEISEEMNYSSPALAKKYRYRCHKSLMELLKKNPHLLQMLKS